jgi:hypothetical protein
LKIYKYKLEERMSQTISIHSDYKLLDIQVQDNCLCLWAIVDSEKPQTNLNVEIYGTGHVLYKPEGLKHLSTVQQGIYVWHIFERVGYEANNVQEL